MSFISSIMNVQLLAVIVTIELRILNQEEHTILQ